jgi:hypothetical protein
MIFKFAKTSDEHEICNVSEIYKIPEIKYVAERALSGNLNLDTVKTIFGMKEKSIKKIIQ